MSHDIFLAHLTSIQKELDLLVHPHLSPVDLRQYFVTREMELLDQRAHIQSSNSTEQSKVKDLTRRLEQHPATPQHWANRALAWHRLHQEDAAMSDFARALQCWSAQTDSLAATQIQQIQAVLRTMDSIHRPLTKRIADNIPKLHSITLPFLESVVAEQKIAP